MLDVTYNSVSFDNCHFSNILCNGDIEDSSLIKFHSSENGNSFDMSNSEINNCKSNGDLIKFDGSKSSIKLSNVKIKNISSYGSIINNISSNVSIIQ